MTLLPRINIFETGRFRFKILLLSFAFTRRELCSSLVATRNVRTLCDDVSKKISPSLFRRLFILKTPEETFRPLLSPSVHPNVAVCIFPPFPLNFTPAINHGRTALRPPHFRPKTFRIYSLNFLRFFLIGAALPLRGEGEDPPRRPPDAPAQPGREEALRHNIALQPLGQTVLSRHVRVNLNILECIFVGKTHSVINYN